MALSKGIASVAMELSDLASNFQLSQSNGV